MGKCLKEVTIRLGKPVANKVESGNHRDLFLEIDLVIPLHHGKYTFQSSRKTVVRAEAALEEERVIIAMCERTVYLSGLSEDVWKDDLQIYFQSKKKSNGGDIENIVFDPDRGEAEIQFVEAKGTD